MKACAAALLACAALAAHPLGNASVNHYARLEPTAQGVDLTYVLDLAEIPSFELFQSWDLQPRAASRAQIESKAVEQARAWLEHLRFTSSGQPVPAHFSGAEVALADGAGGILLLRITAHAQITAAGNLAYEDANYPDRSGWKEIVIAAGAGATITKASQTAADLSRALTEYPADPTLAPPQDLKAELSWTAAGPEVSGAPPTPPGPKAATPRLAARSTSVPSAPVTAPAAPAAGAEPPAPPPDTQPGESLPGSLLIVSAAILLVGGTRHLRGVFARARSKP